jgi:hypothetical protein
MNKGTGTASLMAVAGVQAEDAVVNIGKREGYYNADTIQSSNHICLLGRLVFSYASDVTGRSMASVTMAASQSSTVSDTSRASRTRGTSRNSRAARFQMVHKQR